MPTCPDLDELSHAEKDALIRALMAQLAAAQQQIAVLQARVDELTRPAKTPDNSSKPPSQGQKENLPSPGGDRPARKSRPGAGRTLHPNPDRVVEAKLTACPNCQAAFPETLPTPQNVYERIELPPVKPDVTQVRLFGGRCACCGKRVVATAPAGLEPGSPFGQSIAALVVYLHYAHAIGMERLATLMDEVFSLSISEGAISNMLARAREPLLAAAVAIRETVTASAVVCSDETSEADPLKWTTEPLGLIGIRPLLIPHIMPLVAAAAAVVGMWITRQRYPSAASCPQPFRSCRAATVSLLPGSPSRETAIGGRFPSA